jgi:signal transduction histidine kinase/CheY-like chemotaxis protein
MPVAVDTRELDRETLLAALQSLRRGDLSVRLPAVSKDGDREIARLFNEIVTTQAVLADEVARVAREIERAGPGATQARVPGIDGAWKELTETINLMASGLGGQVRGMQALTEELQRQQEALRAANLELERKARLLSEQMAQVELKNREIELAKAALEEKAAQLTLSSRYKSEFLANMSHELRTPLNSLLILAKLLTDDADSGMSPKHVEFARTIHAAGVDLLSIINDILDLAKIESGTVSLDIAPESIEDMGASVLQGFRQVAEQKGLRFVVDLDKSLPPYIETDAKRLQQILKNLLANAFKFTNRGEVRLHVRPVVKGWTRGVRSLDHARTVLAFSVEDTGIGIPPEKQAIIFEAFQQADGTTSRQFGGTGLGLSISRQLSILLGGEIQVRSEVGVGSAFTLYLPTAFPRAGAASPPEPEAAADDEPTEAPEAATGRRILVADADDRLASALSEAFTADGIQVVSMSRGRPALTALKGGGFECLVVGAGLLDMGAVDFARELATSGLDAALPTVYRVGPLSSVERQNLRMLDTERRALRVPGIRGAVEEVSRIVGRAQPEAPAAAPGGRLHGRTALIVDDDPRNIFALGSILEQQGMSVVSAERARAGIDLLAGRADIDVALVDIMMPGMDGYEAIRAIRRLEQHRSLPIFAVTAKAMKGDRDKCIAAGANEYLPKPVDVEQLLAFMHRWVGA